MYKKSLGVLAIFLAILSLLSGCSGNNPQNNGGDISTSKITETTDLEPVRDGNTGNEQSVVTSNVASESTVVSQAEGSVADNIDTNKQVDNIPDTATRLPVTKSDEMLKGDKVAFNVGVQKNILYSENNTGFDAIIAKSLEQLKDIYSKDSNPNDVNYIEKYNDEFFKENAVVVLFVASGSGSNKLQFDSLVKKDGELCIGMTTLLPGGDAAGTSDMAYWRILLEVKKDDVADIEKISYFNNIK